MKKERKIRRNFRKGVDKLPLKWYNIYGESMGKGIVSKMDNKQYILVNRTLDGRVDGYYDGPHKKHTGMFRLTAQKQFAKRFDRLDYAEARMAALNKGGWNFSVEEAVQEVG